MLKIILQRFFLSAIIFSAVFSYVMLAPHSFYVGAQADSVDVAERKAALEEELKIVEQEINVQTVLVESKQKERVSLERDVAIL